jgi:exonuclease SbcC
MFLTLFKPKWQHSNPDVRVQAIEKLRPEQADHQDILFKLMTEDPSGSVRLAASKRADDLNALVRLLGQINRQGDKHTQTLEQRIVELLDKNPDQQRTLALMLETLGTQVSLKLFAQTQHTQLIESQLDTLDEAMLVELSLSALPLAIRKEAASKLHSATYIEQLVKESRSRDKAIFKLVKDKQHAHKEAIKQQAELQQRAQDLIEQMEQLAHGEWFPLYDARFEVINKAWSTLDHTQLNDDQTLAYQRAYNTTNERITTKAAEEAQVANEKAEHARLVNEATEILRDINAQRPSLDEEWQALFSETTLNTARLSNAQQVLNILAQQLEQWPNALEDAGLTHQKNQLSKALEQSKTAWSNAATLHAELVTALDAFKADDAVISKDQIKAAQAIITQLTSSGSSNDSALPVLAQQLCTKVEDYQTQQSEQQKAAHDLEKRNHQHMTHALDELEKAIEQGEARKADKWMRKVERSEADLNKLPSALQNRTKALSAKLQELKDWQGFAVQPKKEQLCEEMELLIHSELPPQERSNAIKALQAQWKELDLTDPVHSSKLWNRFKSASDQAYAPCEQFFEQQRQARRYNLEQRQLIVKELTAYLDQIDWGTTYWRDVETVLNTAKKEWKQYVPVDRGPGQKVQTAFNDLIVSTESHFKAIKEESLHKKQALIDQARALAESEDPIAAANSAKELQSHWKEAGPTFHSQERKLWMAFRAACDTIFERLSEHQQKDRQRSRLNLSSISDRLYHALNHPTPMEEITAALAEGEAMIESNGDNIKDRERNHFTKLQSQANQLITTLNAAVTADHANAAAIEPIRSAEDLWLEQDHVDTAELETLTAGLASDQLPIIQERLSAWLGEDGTAIQPGDQVKHAHRALREIAIELEIMLGLSSPEDDQALRMEMQMLRLQQVLEQAAPKHTNASLMDQYQLRLAVPLGHLHADALSRIDALIAPYLPNQG